MPPKAKYTREEIVAIALDLVAARGIEALNARNLAAAMGTSTRPLFTAFRNMGELVAEVTAAAMERFNDYALKTDGFTPQFKRVGMQMILFAAEQPKLFQLLFMRDVGDRAALHPWKSQPEDETTEAAAPAEAGSFDDLFNNLGVASRVCIGYIQQDYKLDHSEAEQLFRSVWVYTYGISSLIASGVCRYNENEVSDMLTREFRAVIGMFTAGKAGKPAT
ncbi:MAG: TetR family transcriptional regulator [Oscillospiraceae bacterium]